MYIFTVQKPLRLMDRYIPRLTLGNSVKGVAVATVVFVAFHILVMSRWKDAPLVPSKLFLQASSINTPLNAAQVPLNTASNPGISIPNLIDGAKEPPEPAQVILNAANVPLNPAIEPLHADKSTHYASQMHFNSAPQKINFANAPLNLTSLPPNTAKAKLNTPSPLHNPAKAAMSPSPNHQISASKSPNVAQQPLNSTPKPQKADVSALNAAPKPLNFAQRLLDAVAQKILKPAQETLNLAKEALHSAKKPQIIPAKPSVNIAQISRDIMEDIRKATHGQHGGGGASSRDTEGPSTDRVQLPKSLSCPDVLQGMTKGIWRQRQMTSPERQRIKAFYRKVQVEDGGIPESLQRPDGWCGSITFVGSHLRALCDPEGKTPCCVNSACADKTPDECTCSGCFDMRGRVHAEYATWRPEDERCSPLDLSSPQVCSLLQGTSLLFIGDSLLRHIYTALLFAVTGNDVTGAQAVNIPQNLTANCSGLAMFTDKACGPWLNTDATLCQGKARLRFKEWASHVQAQDVINDVTAVRDTPGAMVILSLGLGLPNGLSDLDTKAFVSYTLRPLAEKMTTERLVWPKLLWVSLHQWGLLRFDGFFRQERFKDARSFNSRVQSFLTSQGIPILDTFALTNNTISYDGAHFGYGVNRVKALVFLNYLLELRTKGQW